MSTSPIRRVFRSGFSAVVLRLLGRLVAYVFALVVGRLLGPGAWGEFSLSLAFISLGSLLALTGLDTAIVKLIGEKGDQAEQSSAGTVRRVFLLATVQAVAVSAVFRVAAPVLAVSVFDNAELAPSFRFAAWAIVPTVWVGLGSKVLNGYQRIAASVLLQQVLRLAFPLMIFVGAWGAVGAIDAYVYGVMALSVLMVLAVVRLEPGGQAEATPVSTRALYALALPLLLASSAGFVKGWADTILVGVFLTSADVGVYDVCFKLASAISIPLWGASTIAAPLIARATAKGDLGELAEIAQASAVLATLVGAPVAAALLVAPEWILGLFGGAFEVGVPTLRWLAVGYLLNTLAGVGGVVMTMSGLHQSYQVSVVVSAVLSIGLNVLLLPVLGIVGAAVSTVLGLVGFNALTTLLVYRAHGVWIIATPRSIRSVVRLVAPRHLAR